MLSRQVLEPLDRDSRSAPLTHSIHIWLRAVVVLGFLSFVTSITLISLLLYRLVKWQIQHKRTNQFVVLIFNLLLADTLQALAFLLNVEWLKLNEIVVHSPICFTQGWLVSTGDLGSGVFCTAIAVHTFASVVFNFRLSQRWFYFAVLGLWVFIHVLSGIPIGMYGRDVYVRSGVWCWIHHNLQDLRLWTHYVWIFVFEFGNTILYALIYAVLWVRIRNGHYKDAEAKHVKTISNLMVAYPLVYVVCTLPLASARMAAMSHHPPSSERLALAGAMITSNGWVDCLLYSLTRRIMVFSDEPPPDDEGFETFTAFWDPPKRFGGTCTVESVLPENLNARKRGLITLGSRNNSVSDLAGGKGKEIKATTTTEVVHEEARPEDWEEMEQIRQKMRSNTPGMWSANSSKEDLSMSPWAQHRNSSRSSLHQSEPQRQSVASLAMELAPWNANGSKTDLRELEASHKSGHE